MVPNLWYLWESTNAPNRPLWANPQLKVCTTGSKRFGSPKKVAESLRLWKGCLPTWDEFPQSCYVSDNARSSVYFPNEPIWEKFCWKNRLSTTLYVFPHEKESSGGARRLSMTFKLCGNFFVRPSQNQLHICWFLSQLQSTFAWNFQQMETSYIHIRFWVEYTILWMELHVIEILRKQAFQFRFLCWSFLEADAWIAFAAFKPGFVVAVICKETIPLIEKEK